MTKVKIRNVSNPLDTQYLRLLLSAPFHIRFPVSIKHLMNFKSGTSMLEPALRGNKAEFPSLNPAGSLVDLPAAVTFSSNTDYTTGVLQRIDIFLNNSPYCPKPSCKISGSSLNISISLSTIVRSKALSLSVLRCIGLIN